MISVRGVSFRVSPLLGSRAAHVYEQFLESLTLDGDMAECGVYAGDTAIELIRYLEAHGIRKRVHLFDTFAGLPDTIVEEDRIGSTWSGLGPGAYASSLDDLTARVAPHEAYAIHAGTFTTQFATFQEPLCFIHADCDLYAGTVEIIALADRLLVPGGRIVFDDYANPRLPGVARAVDRHLSRDDYDGRRIPDSIQYLAIRR